MCQEGVENQAERAASSSGGGALDCRGKKGKIKLWLSTVKDLHEHYRMPGVESQCIYKVQK